jgi:D-alanyl-D-alanine carboxypeptidase
VAAGSRALVAALVWAGATTPQPAGAGPTLLFDPASGQVLYAEDQDDQWYPASLTKIMTAYLVFEAIKAGKLTLETKITASELAAIQPPSKVGLPVGAEMTVDLALQALVVKSANDVAVMLAEAIGTSEAAFIERMNQTAKRLGMTRTRFVNANGLPHPEQVTTARDLARLAQAVVRDFPEAAPYWTLADMQIGKLRLQSHNHLLKSYDGADGLKTGFICDSGYNVVASASRDGRRLMAVVLGEPTGRDRSQRAAGLLEHGFQVQGWKALLSRDTLDTLPPAQDARSAVSMRATVYNYDCGNRRRPIQRTAKAKGKSQPAQAQQQGQPGDGQAAGAAGTQPPPAAAPKQKKAAAAQPAQPAPAAKAQ